MANIALLIAGGSGNRMGQDIPKQFMHVDGCPIIVHTMLCFQRHPDINAIAVVCLRGWETVLQSYANQFGIDKLKWIFPGGGSGMESIHNGIYGLRDNGCADEDLVLIHDSVRPLLSQDIISSNIAICKAYGYAITGIQCREAILESSDGFSTKTSIPRDTLIRTQTPQTFRLKNIIGAHELAKRKGIADSVASCTLIAELKEDIEMHIVPGSEKNIKVTTVEDLEILKALMHTEKDKWLK
ncbi:MAG: 2-C-methyl-D-erythritol 4-phosphate cytidylyltransferase [Lachnospiraceae bacterium]|nr:2-C-methyl-D-erythritol 4-phosphate cytidylyltransferase [Lachnospiraceae bacterium]